MRAETAGLQTPSRRGELNEPGAVLLVACYELGRQPAGIASPMGTLREAGYHPAAADLSIEGLDAEKLALARVVAVSVPMHTALRLGVRLAERIRAENPDCHLCFYGLYAWLNADYLLESAADSVIGGEPEVPLLRLVQALESGERSPIPGVTLRDRRGQAPSPPFLQKTPFALPARDSLPPLERYARLAWGGRELLAGYTEASRGCKHHCLHCPIPPVYGGRFFVVPVETVLADVGQQVRAGARHVTFGDPDFLNGPTHALRVARALHAAFPDVTFDFTAKVEHLVRHAALLPELASLGCLFIISAVESLSDTVLENLRKGHTRADVEQALRLTREAGLTLRPSLVAFTPWTTLDDYLQLFEWVAREGIVDHVDPVQFSIRLLVPPGSILVESPAMRPFLEALDQPAFSYRWRHPDPRMDRLQERIAAEVERAAGSGEDPRRTFTRLRALAFKAAGPTAPPLPDGWLPESDRRPPRLTEAWFC